MIPETAWVWAGEPDFRARVAQVRSDAKAARFEHIGERRFEAAAGPTVVSAGYVRIIHAAGYSAKADLRAQFTQAALVVLDAELCRRVVWPFVGTQFWFPITIERAVLQWVVHNGVEESVATVMVCDEQGIVVATEAELPLPSDYWVERQLLRAELAFRTGQ